MGAQRAARGRHRAAPPPQARRSRRAAALFVACLLSFMGLGAVGNGIGVGVAAGEAGRVAAPEPGAPAQGALRAGAVASAIRFAGAADAGGGNTRTKRVVLPSSTRAGDTALLFFAGTTRSSWTGPTGVPGWRPLDSYRHGSLRTAVWVKQAGADDAGSAVVFTSPAYSHASVNVLVYSGVDPHDPVASIAHAGDRHATDHAAPAVDAHGGDWQVSYWAERARTVRHTTPPPELVLRAASPDSPATALAVQAVLADSNGGLPAGPQGELTATTDGATNYSAQWSMLLRPAGAPGAEPTPSGPVPPSPSASPSPAPTTSSKPTSTPPTTPTSAPRTTPPAGGPAGCVSDRRGIPSSGAYVGAAVSGTQSLPGLESSVGGLALHRSYFMSGEVKSAVATARSDLTAGRLPWISFKLPKRWAAMSTGAGDAWVADLSDRLASVGGPVWLAFHHEPENDTGSEGSMRDWTDMQRHLAPIVHAHAPNVAFTVILMGWNTLFGPSEDLLRNVWPGDSAVDVLGLDIYDEYGAKPGKAHLDLERYYSAAESFAQAHGVAWAVAEAGYTRASVQDRPRFLQEMFDALTRHKAIGLSYFDSSLNSIADWTLDDAARLGAFRELLGRSRRLC